MNAESADEFTQLNTSDEIATLLSAAGFANKQISANTKAHCFQDVLVYEVIFKRRQELDDLRRGLQTVGLASFLSKKSKLISKVFPSLRDVKVDFESIKRKLKPPQSMSEKQKQAYSFLLAFLEGAGNEGK